MDIGAPQMPPGDASLALTVSDRDPALPSVAELRSSFDLEPLDDALAASGVHRPWEVLACAAGPGQLILDCTLDAMVPDEELDCVVNGTGAPIEQIDTLRGDVDLWGCRPAMVLTEPSLDQAMTDAVVDGASWPTGADLDAMLQARQDTLTSVDVTSELRLLADAAAQHELRTAAVQVDGDVHEIDLLATDRPVLRQSQVPVSVHLPPRIDLAAHGFTLRYGSIARAAFRALGLEPRGLGERAHDLGAALVESVSESVSETTGCAAVSAIICAKITDPEPAPADCAQLACEEAALSMNAHLAAWWELLDGVALDLVLTGSALLYDFDDDLTIDAIGTDASLAHTGAWSATFSLANEEEIATSGGFGSSETVAVE
jgi:hypothetical protein